MRRMISEKLKLFLTSRYLQFGLVSLQKERDVFVRRFEHQQSFVLSFF